MKRLQNAIVEISFRLIFYASNWYLAKAAESIISPFLVLVLNILAYEILQYFVSKIYKPRFDLRGNVVKNKKNKPVLSKEDYVFRTKVEKSIAVNIFYISLTVLALLTLSLCGFEIDRSSAVLGGWAIVMSFFNFMGLVFLVAEVKGPKKGSNLHGMIVMRVVGVGSLFFVLIYSLSPFFF